MPQHRVSGEASPPLAVKDQLLREILSLPRCRWLLAQLIQAKLDSLDIRFSHIPDDCWTSIELGNQQLGVNVFYGRLGKPTADIYKMSGEAILASMLLAENIPLLSTRLNLIHVVSNT